MSFTEKLEKASACLNKVEACFPRAADAAFAVIITSLSIFDFSSGDLLHTVSCVRRSHSFDFVLVFTWQPSIRRSRIEHHRKGRRRNIHLPLFPSRTFLRVRVTKGTVRRCSNNAR